MNVKVMPERRNLVFHLPTERVGNWHPAGPEVSHFFNAMSLFFPTGERFFIDSVRLFQDRVENPELRAAIREFIGQEAMHGREHEAYNRALAERGLPAERFERLSGRLLAFLQRMASKKYQLAATMAVEHLTAILADAVLSDERVLDGAEEHFRAIWTWHALEETEHKSVAFDVYQEVVGNGLMAYFRRCFALLEETFFFWLLVIPAHVSLVTADSEGGSLRGWWRTLVFLWGRPGVLRRQIPAWLRYFKPGFHPWQHDNRAYLQRLPGVLKQIDEFQSDTPISVVS